MAKRQRKAADKSAKGKKKRKKQVANPSGMAFIKATFNNVLVSVTDANGNVLSWSSSGKEGFKGSRKNAPYSAHG